jgi:sugar transferase (PEP-CTERM/EpsH1 system associated)
MARRIRKGLMNILYLSPRVPFPPERGDKIRSFFQVSYLAKEHKIFLGTTLDNETDLAYIGKMRKHCSKIHAVRFHRGLRMLRAFVTSSPFSVCAFYDRGLQAFVDHCLESSDIDAILCYCSSMAEYVFRSRMYRQGTLGKIRLYIDFVDLDSDKWGQFMRYSRSPLKVIYAMEEKRLRKYEIRINRSFHGSVFVADREVEVFRRNFPDAMNVSVISNGVNHEFFAPRQGPMGDDIERKGGTLVFSGIMNYFANVDGVCWFCNKVLPMIKKQFPGVEFLIVGKDPVPAVKRLSHISGVSVTGYVPDIRKYYWLADVCVIPLRIARGLQNKVLEAMASGRAVVTTSNASDGIRCNPGDDIVIADDENKFASAVISLLSDRKRNEELGACARKTVLRNYSWEANMQAFDNLLAE